MNLQTVKKLISEGESETLELKRSTAELHEGLKTACAFLNGHGGKVLFGVRPDGTLLGQEVSDKTLREIAQAQGRFEPAVHFKVDRIPLKGRMELLALNAESQVDEGPFTYEGLSYERIQSTTRKMPQKHYEHLLMERAHVKRRWENEPAGDVSLKDLDAQEIRRTLSNAVRAGRMEATSRTDIKSILVGLGLIVNNRLLNAAVALYGKSKGLEAFYPQCALHLARFRGTDRLADFADNRQYWGHAFELLRRAESFLMDHVPIAGRVIAGKLVREDRPLYPPRATREALANAFCHRDYVTPGGAVAVAMYNDRLEIVNPGTLHFGITPRKLLEPHESKPWNPIIAKVFYRAGIIEKWGSGTLNILDWCKDNGNPHPVWQERTQSVVTTFLPNAKPFPQAEPTTGRASTQVTMQVTTQVVEMLRRAEVPRSREELQRAAKLDNREHFRKAYLKPLLAEGLLAMTIPDKPNSRLQKYVLTEKGKEQLQKGKTV